MKIDILQIYYDAFINQKNQGKFMAGMADYVEKIIDDDDCNRSILGIQKVKDEFLKENTDNVASERVFNEEYNELEEDRNILAVKSIKSSDIILAPNSVFSNRHLKTTTIEKKMEEAQGATLWKAWEEMCLAYLRIFKKKGAVVDIELRDKYDNWIFQNYPNIVFDRQIDIHNKQDVICIDSNGSIIKPDYKSYVSIVHSYLLKELEGTETMIVSKKKERNIADFNFPKDLQWEEIEIKFFGSEDALIISRNEHTQTNCLAMDFQNSKNKKPDLQWTLLHILAKRNGVLSWENNNELEKKEFDTVKSKKKTIKNRLQKIFGIKSDPFYPYNKKDGYEIKLKLSFGADDISDSDNENSKSATEDWRSYLEDSTPSLYE